MAAPAYRVARTTLVLPGDPDQILVSYVAEPGSPTAERLAVPGSWSASVPSADGS